ncbi:MAG: DegV family protein [Oscillospiraceae bacterium]
MNKIGISTDCVCDLPEDYLTRNDVGILYFYIATSTGRFRDGFEITSGNILEYLENGGAKSETMPPEPEEYRDFFLEQLEKCDELIHIAISSGASLSCRNANAALELLGEKRGKVRVIDSGHLSTGMGHIVIRAAEMRSEGYSADEIAAAAERLKKRVSTSFITMNADYLYRNGRVSKAVKNICGIFMLHPVLVLKNGKITLKNIRIGNYDKAVMRYIKSELRRSGKIDKRRLFITHAGCSIRQINAVKERAAKLCEFNEVTVTKASATVSCNCGAGTVGVLFVRADPDE